jgi:hypothetical protein
MTKAEEEAVWAPMTKNVTPTERPIDLLLEWQAPVDVYAPSWSGLVTGNSIIEGATITSGDVALSIDNIGRIALHTPMPFSRNLSSGSTGPDVAMLNRALSAMGYAADAKSDRFTWATVTSVRALAARLGVINAASLYTFDASWVVYLPANILVVDDSNAHIGAPAPLSGTLLFVARGRLLSATLVEPSLDTTRTGNEGPEEVEPEDEETATTGLPQIVADPGEQLYVAGKPIPIGSDRASVSEDALEVLRGLTKQTTTHISATLRSQPDGNSWVVPSASIIQGLESTCVIVAGADSNDLSTELVDVVGSRIGVSIVRGELSTFDHVLVSPSSDLRQCP